MAPIFCDPKHRVAEISTELKPILMPKVGGGVAVLANWRTGKLANWETGAGGFRKR
jgi:hypothetical protein